MRHRMGMAGQTGLGNPNPQILMNEWSEDFDFNLKVKSMILNGMDLFFKGEGVDFTIYTKEVRFGIEPAYQYEDLKIISINENIGESYIQAGRAWGDYGSKIASHRNYHRNYKLKSKFIRFINKWHPILYVEGGDTK